MKPHLTYLISHPHAVAMIKKMSTKKQRNQGYSFEMEDIPEAEQFNAHQRKYQHYANYNIVTTLCRLNVFYEKPQHETQVKESKPRRSTRK